jgi:hypothetical protein
MGAAPEPVLDTNLQALAPAIPGLSMVRFSGLATTSSGSPRQQSTCDVPWPQGGATG